MIALILCLFLNRLNRKDNYMKTICLGLERDSYPVYELDENGYIGDVVSLEELGVVNHLC